MLRIGLPLVASMGSSTLMHFTDRAFLGDYSLDAIAAAGPAGAVFFLFTCFFIGTVSYVGVFIAQYTGAGAFERVGPALWQGVWFALLTGLALLPLALAGPAIFAAGGHPPELIALEVEYYRVMMLGSVLMVLETGLSSFFTGRGLTRVVMCVNAAGALINVPLDYMLINGTWIFPELGVAGAALATVAAWTFMVAAYGLLIFSRDNDRLFAVRRNIRLDRELFFRLMRYGLPGGVQFFVDMFAVTFFIFMMGRVGKLEMAATNIAFAINTLAFLPMVGLSIAVSALVGQALGAERPDEAHRAKGSAVHLAMAYMTLAALIFVLWPDPLLNLFRPRELTPADYAPIRDMGRTLLLFIAAYCTLDAWLMMTFGALKGAGDSRFLMYCLGTLAVTALVLPVYAAVDVFGAGLYPAWTIFTIYVGLLAVALDRRYRSGKWRTMRVIETSPAGH